MGYERKIYEEASAELERRRQIAEGAAREKREAFYARCPEAEAIQEAIASNAAGAAKAVISGGNVREELEKLKSRASKLSEKYDGLLKKEGLTRQDITPRYTCEICSDTGIHDGKMCSCFKELQKSIAYRNLSMDVPLEKSTFASFSLDYYQNDERAYRQMEMIFHSCKSYAERFRSTSPSLLFKGGTGLGKTHLSLAIAGEVIKKGFGVIYGSAQSFALSLEKERFDRRDPSDLSDTQGQLVSCDLLILDDLGTEFPSAYVNAALYDVLNTRMLARKPTIISTNLSLAELEKRYSERFASRISGYYGKYEFLGRDVRIEQQKSRRSKAVGGTGA